MPIGTINNGDSGSSARTKINAALTAVDGLGDSATKDVGTSAGDVAAGDDGRFSNARTPTVHAGSHTDGTDDIQDATASQKGLATATQITKLNGIEAGADVTDAVNVAAAGALMATDLGAGVETALGVNLGSAGSILVTDYAADAGSTDAYAATLNPAPSALVTGAHYRFKANTANTGAATIDFNGLGAKTIVKAAGGITTALADNDIRAGQWVDVVYDGTNMQMQSTLGNASAFDPASPGTIGATTPGIGYFSQLTYSPTYWGNLTWQTNVFGAWVAGLSGNVGVALGDYGGSYLYTFFVDANSRAIFGTSSNPVHQDFFPLASAPTLQSGTAGIYSKDVAGTTEMFVMDEAGNETQISPHNASAPAQIFDSPFDEIKTTCNYYTGIIWHKNTQRQLAGRPDAQVIETFEECLFRLGADCDPMIAAGAWDWDTVQAGHVAKSVAARADWAARQSAWEADPKNKDKLFTEEQPKLVVAKPMPKTLANQLVGKAEFLAKRESAGTTVSKTSMLLAMAEKGLYTPDDPTSALTAAIANMPDPAQKAEALIFFKFENVVKRFHPVVLGLQQSLGLDDAAVDALFVAAKPGDDHVIPAQPCVAFSEESSHT